MLNLNTVYAARQQLHGQAAFFPGEIALICTDRALQPPCRFEVVKDLIRLGIETRFLVRPAPLPNDALFRMSKY
jgi:hypothetical protein